MSNNMSYSALLRDPRWQRKRLEVLQRDDFTCCSCEDKETTLHVHHKKYRKGAKPWEYENDQLETLCETCHSEHFLLKKEIDCLLQNVDVHLLKQCIGYLKARIHSDMVFNEEILITPHTTELNSYHEIFGFSDGLGIKRSATRVDKILEILPINNDKLFQLETEGF